MKASKKYQKDKNLSIEFLRFLFALLVVMVHTYELRPENPDSYPFVGGYIAVEFFLILSGYFTLKSISEIEADSDKCGKIALHLTWKRFKNLFFFILCSVMLQYIVEAIVQKMSFYTTAKNLMYSIFEILLLPMSGIYQTFFDSPLWYLSSFFLVLPLFQYLLLRYRDFISTIFLTLVPLLVYGHFCVTYGELDRWNIWYGFFYIGTLRVLAGLCMGGICFWAASALKKTLLTKTASVLIGVLQIIMLSLIFFISYKKAHTRLDFILVLLITLFLILTLSEQGIFHKAFKFPFFLI